MKKVLSLILAISLVMGLIPGNLMAYDEPHVTDVTTDDLDFIVYTHMVDEHDWIGEEEVSWASYDVYPQHVTVTYSDGSVLEGSRDDIYNETGCWPDFWSDQRYDNQWGIGVHEATISFMGVQSTYTVTISESPVASISVDDITFMEGTNGHWEHVWDEASQDWVDWFMYNADIQHMTVTYRNGDVLEGTPDEIFEQTGESVSTFSDQNYNNQWDIGRHAMEVSFMGVQSVYYVEITGSPVTSVFVEDVTIYQNDRQFMRNYPEWQGGERVNWVGYEIMPERLTVFLNDGRSFEGTLQEVQDEFHESVTCSSDQTWNNRWGIGSHNVKVSFMGAEYTYRITIVESPVLSVETDNVTAVVGTNGFWDGYWDETRQEWINQSWYRYDIRPEHYIITYKTGEVLEGSVEDLLAATGREPFIVSDQSSEAPWNVGEHEAIANFMGADCTFLVTITESPIQSVTADNVSYIEGTHQYRRSWQTDGQEPLVWNEYDTQPEQITVVYKNGDVFQGDARELEELTGERVSCQDDQSYENRWGLGEHEVTGSFMGVSFTYTIEIIESPIASIYAADVTVLEGDRSRMITHHENEDGQEWTWMGYEEMPERLTVVYKNGDVLEDEARLIQDQLDEDIRCESDQSRDNQWSVGEHEITVSFMGQTCTYRLIIEETPVLSIQAEGAATVIEGTEGFWDGYWDNENQQWVDNTWYRYEVSPQTFTITYKNSDVIQGSADDIYRATGERLFFESDQSPERPWGIGEHEMTVSFMGVSCTYPVVIQETPIASISAAGDLTLIEHTGGFWDGYWDEEAGRWLDDTWYNYHDIWPDTFTVTYKNGNVIQGSEYDIYNATGESIRMESDQGWDRPWGLGQHEIRYSFMGVACTCTVEIVETPIASISAAGDLTVIEYTGGFWDGYWDEETGRWLDNTWYDYHDIWPDTFTVTYKSGEVIEGTRDDIYRATGEEVFMYSDQSYDNPWTVGPHEITFTFLGASCVSSVTIVETPVASITANAMTVVEHTEGFWDGYYDEEIGEWVEGDNYIYEPWPSSFTVTYKSGDVLEGSRDEILEATGYDIDFYSDQSEENVWGLGEHEMNYSFLGVSCVCPVTIIETPVASITANGSITAVAGVDGGWAGCFDVETGAWLEEGWYAYDLWPESFTVTFKNGDVLEGNRDEILDATGKEIYPDSDQSPEAPWSAGTHEITFNFMGVSCVCPVTLIEELPAAGYTVSGNVTSFGAESDAVTIELIPSGESEPAYGTVVSGNKADYVIENVAPGSYTVRVSKNGHVTRTYEIAVSDADVALEMKIHRPGDLNGDGKITVADVGKANSHAKGVKLLSGYELACADVAKNDGKVTSIDVARINAHAKGTSMLW